MLGRVFNIQPFSIHDGDGLRTVVFMKGCNLRCYWCHNPESHDRERSMQFFAHKCIRCGECAKVCPAGDGRTTALFTDRCIKCGRCADVCWSEARVAAGYDISAEELFGKLRKDREIFRRSGGGVTFSGGEPLLQAQFVAEVMRRCREEGISTAVETAACVPWENFEAIEDLCDCLICDIKTMDSGKHREATGAGNERILANIARLAQQKKRLVIRTPVIPGFNDTPEEILRIRDFVSSLGEDIRYGLLAFHGICVGKYESLNREFQAKDLPDADIAELEKLLR